jgi:hypothetical protein
VAIVAGAVGGTVAAEPRLFVPGGSLETKETLVGDDVNVTVRVKNTGEDGGALTVDIRRNGTTVASERVVVESDSEVRITKAIAFDEPGTYEIRANDVRIGTVRAQRATTRVTNVANESRTVEIRGGGVPTTEPYAIDVPAATNRSFTIERWAVEASEDRFTHEVTEYTTPSASSVTLPDDEGTAIVGVVTVGSTGDVDAVTMRFAVDRATLRDADIDADALAVYSQDGATWTEAETSVVEERTESVVYEARTTEFATLAVGSIQPIFDVEETNLRTVQTDAGRQLVVEAVVSNSGSVDGEYEATMSVNDEVTNSSITQIPAGEERTVTLTHEVTTAGDFQVALNGRSAGSVVITEGQVGTEPPGQTDTRTETDTPGGGNGDGGDGGADGGDGGLPDGVPETIAGLDTIGVGVALLVFFGALALLRRGDGGGGSDFEL